MTGRYLTVPVREMLQNSIGEHAERTAFLEKTGDVYRSVSYATLGEEMAALGTALLKVLPPNPRVLLLGKNSYAYALSLLTLLSGVGLPIPVDAALSGASLRALAAESGANAVLYAGEEAAKTVDFPGLVGISFTTYPQLMAQGRAELAAGDDSVSRLSQSENTPAALFYGADSRGGAKGVCVSQGGILTVLSGLADAMPVTPADTFLSVLPLSHISECVAGLLYPLSCGAAVAFATGVSTLLANMRETHPTCMVTVPYVAERIYRRFFELAAKNGMETEVRRAITLTDPVRPLSVRQAMKEKLLSAARAPFGGALRRLLVVEGFLDTALHKGLRQIGMPAWQTYTVPEATGFLAIGREDVYRDGAVGFVPHGCEVEIVNADVFGNGEILCRGKNLLLGYCNGEGGVSEPDGTYRTGDIGRLDKNGCLYVMGRTENVLSVGEDGYVCPEELERLLRGGPLVADAVVVGVPTEEAEGNEIAALLYPDKLYVAETYGEAACEEELERAAAEWVSDVNADLPAHKQITLFSLRSEPFPRHLPERTMREALVRELLNTEE